MIELSRCTKKYKEKVVFENVDITLGNAIYRLSGPNGTGKSVLLRCMAGLEDFSQGQIKGNMKNILYLPDVPVGDGWLTMKENINLMQYFFKLKFDDKVSKKVCSNLIITEGDELVSRLSTGNAMKVGLSLIFAKNHWDVIILDETISHLDMQVRENIIDELNERANEGSCILFVHHGEPIQGKNSGIIRELYLNKNGIEERN